MVYGGGRLGGEGGGVGGSIEEGCGAGEVVEPQKHNLYRHVHMSSFKERNLTSLQSNNLCLLQPAIFT